jgi:predicted acyltransferase
MSTGTSHPASTPPAADGRLLSLDAYRGLIMITLAFDGFGLAATAANVLESRPDSSFWQAVRHQFSHVPWAGCSFWDLIQPSFMFMVGVSMAYSYVNRAARGQSDRALFLHAVSRSAILVLLGVFLSSVGPQVTQTNWTFTNVLSQIGLGYPFLFLSWRRPVAVQAVAVAGLLVVTFLAYRAYPTAGIDLTTGDAAVGIPAAWARDHLADVDRHWHKNANLGHAVDTVFLNWFPRQEPFRFNPGGYPTINFIPALATMLIGLICGETLRSPASERRRLTTLLGLGVGGIVAGLAWQQLGCPIVKRLWTPSWTLFSGGICVLILTALYAVIDVAGQRRWSSFAVVVGVNSIAIYMMSQLLRGWTAGRLRVHLVQPLAELVGGGTLAAWSDFMPLVEANAVGLAFWLVCLWMAKQKIFIRV